MIFGQPGADHVKHLFQAFVIDKEGDIRFKAVGYGGSPNEELKKVTAMVEMLRTGAC